MIFINPKTDFAFKRIFGSEQSAVKQGIQQGIQQGIEQGIQQGAKEAQVKMAKRLLSMMDDETLSQMTELSIEEIRRLREEN